MSTICPQVFGLCRLRITRLETTGRVADSPNNSWVTDKQISFGFDPVIEVGEEHTNKNGCGQILSSFTDPDIRKRYDLSLQLGADVPGLREMLLGDAVILDGADPVGSAAVDQNSSTFEPTLVAVEGWFKMISGDAPDSGRPWGYILFPASSWVEAPAQLGNDYWNPQYTGKSRTNGLWGDGPYGDVPELAGVDQAVRVITQTTGSPPSADCAYGSVVPSS